MALEALPDSATDPMSTSSASFDNDTYPHHTQMPARMPNGNGFMRSTSIESGSSAQAEGSRDARVRDREMEAALRQKAGEQQPDSPTSIEAFRMESSSPRINPFHLLSHPNSSDPLPPLPPHLQAIASDTGDPPSHPFSAFPDEFHQTSVQLASNGHPPVHITKVTHDTVKVVSGPAGDAPKPNRLMKKVSGVFKKGPSNDPVSVSQGLANVHNIPPMPMDMQRPPPSPPLSEDGYPDGQADGPTAANGTVDEVSSVPNGTSLSPVHEAPPPLESPVVFSSALTAEPADMANSSPIRTTPSPPPVSQPPADQPSTRKSSAASIGAKAGPSGLRGIKQPRKISLDAAALRGADERDKSLPPLPNGYGGGENLGRPPSATSLPPISSPRHASPASGDYLHPSSAMSAGFPRITRRSTNPSPISTSMPTRSPLIHSQSTFSHSPPLRSQTTVPGVDGAALDSDILAQAETIRRERLERRQKKASAKETAAEPLPESGEIREKTPAPPVTAKKEKDEAKVLVGNLIGEDHVNYVLMYNMLTGIRIGVSRCQAKIKRALTPEDYTARHKFSFDIVGNELTPSAKYDFKFKDYAPWVFRELRDEHFHLDPADYLLSLTAKYILSELGSPGKSGSFFYFSRDYRFIIKTISHSEHKFLRSILFQYHQHVKANPHTLLSRFYGLHRVKLPRGRKIHFVIMNNLFPPHRDIHETYDLKGSAFGREYPEEKASKNPKAVLKDKNWVNRGRTLELGPEKRALFSEQLRRDMEFLKAMKVMDYSLLVGIHNMERGNKDNLRENQLSVFHPDVTARRKPSSAKTHDASNVRKAVRRSDPKSLDVASQLPTADSADRRHFLFYQDEGGLRATDEQNQPMDVIYYLGVIDICTPYNTVKKLEHFWKSMTEGATISCVDPVTYGQRFINFLVSVMRGGNIALRPEGLLPDVSKADEAPVGESTAAAAEHVLNHPTAAARDLNQAQLRMRDAEKGGAPLHPSPIAEDGSAGGEEEEEKRAIVGHLKAD